MVETQSGRRFAILFLVAACIVLLLGHWLEPVDRVALTAAAPFTSAVSGVANWFGDGLSGITNGPRLQSEVNSLRKQNARLIRATIGDAELRHENAVFKRMLRFAENNGRYDLMLARVIGTDANALSPDILINRGSRDGIQDGMTVLDQNGYFVGTVTDTVADASRVQLMLSPSSSVAAYDMRTRAPGLVEGQFDSAPQLNYVPTSMSLRAGDPIVTSGQCNLYPRGLVLGQITSVQRRNVAVEQTAQIQPAADFRTLEMTMVIRNFVPAPPARLNCKP